MSILEPRHEHSEHGNQTPLQCNQMRPRNSDKVRHQQDPEAEEVKMKPRNPQKQAGRVRTPSISVHYFKNLKLSSVEDKCGTVGHALETPVRKFSDAPGQFRQERDPTRSCNVAHDDVENRSRETAAHATGAQPNEKVVDAMRDTLRAQ